MLVAKCKRTHPAMPSIKLGDICEIITVLREEDQVLHNGNKDDEGNWINKPQVAKKGSFKDIIIETPTGATYSGDTIRNLTGRGVSELFNQPYESGK